MSPSCIDPWDWSRSYLLPDHVQTNIPRRGFVGSYGAHNAARGLLVEICRATGAAPVALDFRDAEVRDQVGDQLWGQVRDEPCPGRERELAVPRGVRDDLVVIVVVTATAALPAARPSGELVVVTTRRRSHRWDDRDDDWTIAINGTVLDAEARRYPPSPPFQGLLVAWHLQRR